MLYPLIKIRWERLSGWSIRCFIFGCICKILGHKIKDLSKQAYPGHVFCVRCRQHVEWRIGKGGHNEMGRYKN